MPIYQQSKSTFHQKNMKITNLHWVDVHIVMKITLPLCKGWWGRVALIVCMIIVKHIQAPPISINTTQISARHPPDIPQTPPDIPREHDMPTDNNRCQGTYARHTPTAPVCVLGCLAVSVCVCWCLLVCCVPWRCHGVIWGMSGGCLKDIWLVFIEIGGALMCLGGMWVLSLTVWSKNTI